MSTYDQDLTGAADDAMRDQEQPQLTDAEAVEQIARTLRECNLPAWSDALLKVREIVAATGRDVEVAWVGPPRSGYCTLCGKADHAPDTCPTLPY